MEHSFFRNLTFAYLIPMGIFYVANNTGATGTEAHVWSAMFGVTLALAAFSFLPKIGEVLNINVNAITSAEWAYNAALAAFCAVGWWLMAGANASETGFWSILALVLEWYSAIVGVVAFLAFWLAKGEDVKHALVHEQPSQDRKRGF